MKIIDGKNAVLGRLASYAAKEALKGEDIIILNCEHIIITGNKRDIRETFERKRRRVGSGQKGPKHSRTAEKIVKRTIRGMLSHKQTRGRESMKRIKCYNELPKEFEGVKKIRAGKEKRGQFITLKELTKLIK